VSALRQSSRDAPYYNAGGSTGAVFLLGGVLAFSESLTDPDYVFQRELRDLCRAMGFRELSCSRERLGYTMTFAAP